MQYRNPYHLPRIVVKRYGLPAKVARILARVTCGIGVYPCRIGMDVESYAIIVYRNRAERSHHRAVTAQIRHRIRA